jgi:hypothetical protein
MMFSMPIILSINKENKMEKTVKITAIKDHVYVSAPYNELFIKEARNIGGTWDKGKKEWVFDLRDESRTRELCLQYFGVDGVVSDICSLSILWAQNETCGRGEDLTVYGRQLARNNMDDVPSVGSGVIVEAGGFTRGGTRGKCVTAPEGTKVVVRNFSRAAAEKLISNGSMYRNYSLVEDAPPTILSALQAERVRLVARLAEIDALLAA